MAAAIFPLTHDFTPALTALDPYHQYFASPLSGGLMNATVRVSISTSTEEHKCAYGGARSVVAKYAPPFWAGVGESAPFSQYRQVIEARALALLSQPNISAYIRSSNVGFPELVHHNPDKHVLVMSDLGDTVTLDTWFASGPDTNLAAEVGSSFGEFLGRLNSIFELVKKDYPNLYEHFENRSAQEFLYNVIITKLEPNILECVPNFDPAKAAVAGKMCISMYERQQARINRRETGVFSIGDSWPKAYLIGHRGGPTLELSAVDWEFAGMIGPLVDLSQLCAHLYVLGHTSARKIKSAVKAYALELIRAHYVHTPEWQYKSEYRADGWVVFGLEVVNLALGGDWWNGDEDRKLAGRKLFGQRGAAFIIESEQRGMKDGPLFEDVFINL